MKRWHVAAAGALAAISVVVLSGAPTAPTATYSFSGEIPATAGACGPLHDFDVPPGTTTVDAVATAMLPSNDIVLNLHHPPGTIVATSDSATSPEAIHYVVPFGGTGTYSVQVCFAGNAALIAAPTTYTIQVTTSDAPLPPVGTPGGSPPVISGTPVPSRAAGKLTFGPMTIVDPQRTEGEPLNTILPSGEYWESGPFGTSTQQSWVHRSTDGGLEFHETSPLGLRPDGPPGGGDTDVVADDQGFAYFSDLEGLAQVSTSVSNDGGNTWKKNAVASQETCVDRQWYAVDTGLTSRADDNTIFFVYRQTPAETQILSSPGSTGTADP